MHHVRLPQLAACGDLRLIPLAWRPAHPDPHGAHCAILAIALRALINEKADAGATLTGPSGTQRYGVFIDFCSLFQHPDPSAGVFRTPEEDARFKLALSTLSALYSALGTNVLRLTVLRKIIPTVTTCQRAATSHSTMTADGAIPRGDGRHRSSDRDVRSGPAQGPRNACRARLPRRTCRTLCSRRSQTPAAAAGGLCEALQQKAFTNGKDDRPLVEALYRQEFESTFRNVHVLRYQALGWGDEEILLVASALDAVVEPGDRKHKTARAHRATPLNELYLMGNTFGDAAAQPLLDVLPTQGPDLAQSPTTEAWRRHLHPPGRAAGGLARQLQETANRQAVRLHERDTSGQASARKGLRGEKNPVRARGRQVYCARCVILWGVGYFSFVCSVQASFIEDNRRVTEYIGNQTTKDNTKTHKTLCVHTLNAIAQYCQ